MAMDGKDITVTSLLGAGLILLLVGMFVPWAQVEALDTTYGVWGADAPADYVGWFSGDVDDFDGVGLLRTGAVVSILAAVAAAAGLTLSLLGQRLWAAITGGTSLVAALLGVILTPVGASAFYDDAIGVDGFMGWHVGLYLGIAGAAVLLAAFVLGLVWTLVRRGGDAGEPEPDPWDTLLGEAVDDGGYEAPAATEPEHSGEWPDPDKPLTRKLRCPECGTVFPSRRGDAPVCPNCRYGE